MNRLTAWTVAAIIAAAVAVIDLLSAWAVQLGAVFVVLTFALFGIGIAVFVALIVAGFGERRRITAAAASSVDLVSRATRSVRWSALAAIALSVLWFANCSGAVTSTPTLPNVATSSPALTSAAMGDVPGLMRIVAEALLPIVLVIALAAALATAASWLAGRQRWRSALRAARAAVWTAVAIVIVAVLTVPVGFIFGVAYCDVGGSPGACAGGLASLGDVFLAGTAALLLPYILVLDHAVKSAASSPPPAQAAEQ
jgi:hypothetical protein